MLRALLVYALLVPALPALAQTCAPTDLLGRPVPQRKLTLLKAADPRPFTAPLPGDAHTIPTPYSYDRLGVFCKLDVRLRNWCGFPVLLRMGDVEQAEELDGKGALHPDRYLPSGTGGR